MPQHTLSNAGSRISIPSFTCGRDPGRFVRKRAKWKARTNPMWKLYGLSLTVLILTTANRPAASLAQHSLSCVKENSEAITVRRLNANCECPDKRAI